MMAATIAVGSIVKVTKRWSTGPNAYFDLVGEIGVVTEIASLDGIDYATIEGPRGGGGVPVDALAVADQPFVLAEIQEWQEKKAQLEHLAEMRQAVSALLKTVVEQCEELGIMTNAEHVREFKRDLAEQLGVSVDTVEAVISAYNEWSTEP